MWYIFNKDNKCIASCDFQPNIEDLSSREEIAIEHKQEYNIKNIILKNSIITLQTATLTDNEIKQYDLSALDAKYQPQFVELSQALGMAALSDNTDIITNLKANYIALKAEYDAKRGEIIG